MLAEDEGSSLQHRRQATATPLQMYAKTHESYGLLICNLI
jgi:hypothetical protein